MGICAQLYYNNNIIQARMLALKTVAYSCQVFNNMFVIVFLPTTIHLRSMEPLSQSVYQIRYAFTCDIDALDLCSFEL